MHMRKPSVRRVLRILSYSDLLDNELDIGEVFFGKILKLSLDMPFQRDAVHKSIGIFGAEIVRSLNTAEIKEGGIADITVYKRFETFRRHKAVAKEIDFVLSVMKNYIGRIVLDDHSGPFRALFEVLNEKYRGDGSRCRECPADFFPRNAAVAFVQSDYLMHSGVVQALSYIRSELANLSNPAVYVQNSSVRRVQRVGFDGMPDLVVAAGHEMAASYEAVSALTKRSDVGTAVILDIVFGLNSTYQDAIIDGWCKAEPSFIWTSGHCARLQFVRPDQAQDYRLLLFVSPFVSPPKVMSQRASIAVNGRPVGSAMIDEHCVSRGRSGLGFDPRERNDFDRICLA